MFASLGIVPYEIVLNKKNYILDKKDSYKIMGLNLLIYGKITFAKRECVYEK
jgi:hypothetical protein